MKAMILTDFIVMRKYLIQQSVIGLVLGVVLAFIMENPYVILPLVGVMVSVTCAFTLLALDERNRWEAFRLALPLSRRNVVVGRYASLFASSTIGFAVGVVASILVVVLASVLMGLGYGSAGALFMASNVALSAYALAGVAGALIISVMLSVMLPLAFRFGMTRAVRFVPMIVVVAVLVAFAATTSGSADFIVAFSDVLLSAGGIWAFAAFGAVLSLAIYVLSAVVACRLYESREL